VKELPSPPATVLAELKHVKRENAELRRQLEAARERERQLTARAAAAEQSARVSMRWRAW
jgi:hypothetical protein